jgi:choline dehydrogenase
MILGFSNGSLEEILDWVRKDGETALHPSCSAKMGPASDPMAVVDFLQH